MASPPTSKSAEKSIDTFLHNLAQKIHQQAKSSIKFCQCQQILCQSWVLKKNADNPDFCCPACGGKEFKPVTELDIQQLVATGASIITQGKDSSSTSDKETVAGVIQKFQQSQTLLETVIKRHTIQDNTYFESQKEGLGCGRHALNNLMGGEVFQTGETQLLTSITPHIGLQNVCFMVGSLQMMIDGAGLPMCPSNENYDVNVLRVALNLIGYELGESKYLQNFWDTSNSSLSDNSVVGYLFNLCSGMANGKPIHSHWVSVKKVSDDTLGQKLIYYDSLWNAETGGLPITKDDHDKCT